MVEESVHVLVDGGTGALRIDRGSPLAPVPIATLIVPIKVEPENMEALPEPPITRPGYRVGFPLVTTIVLPDRFAIHCSPAPEVWILGINRGRLRVAPFVDRRTTLHM
jgi:hypothetical protein